MLKNFGKGLRALLWKSASEYDLDVELKDHIERQTQQNIRLGMPPEEALVAARKAFGGVEQAKERSRDARGVRWLEELWQDLRYGARRLRKKPVFATVTILTLALGIGANTSIFSLINAALLRPLPFPQPDRLAHLWQTHPTIGSTQTAYLDFIAWRRSAKSFQGMAGYTFQAMNQVSLLGEGEPEQVQATMVSHDLLSILGVKMRQGRNFTADDEQQAAPVVLISERLWRRKFSADPKIIGRAIRLGPTANTVIGVVPDHQAFPSWADVWMPLSFLEPMLRETRRFRPLEVIGRLKDGVSLEEAHSELSTIAINLGREFPETNQSLGASVISLLDKSTNKARPGLFIAWMAVGLVFMIACANVAHLLLARTISRRREIAIRLSVGATPRRILRLLAIECMLIVVLGGILGTAMAKLGLPSLQLLAVSAIPRADEAGIDLAVLSYMFAALLITTLIILFPSYLELRRANLSYAMRQCDASVFSNRGVGSGQFSWPRRLRSHSSRSPLPCCLSAVSTN
jgi:predicted permease